MKTTRLAIGVACCLAFLLAGCASYYKVTDPTSGKNYYSESVKEKSDGSVRFKDANTGANVTLQSSEVHEISKDEFKANTGN